MTLDIQTIAIDEDKLEELSRKAPELSNRTKAHEQKKQHFDSELMSIIGSINSRAKAIRNRMKVNDENTYPEGKKSRSTSIISRDPLQDISIEYSNDSDKKIEEGNPLDDSVVES